MLPAKKNKKVFVGLSGGVDSAVAAALLKQEGYDVVGVFIRTWHPAGMPCTEPEDRRFAMRVAAHLSIPFTTLDLSERYRRDVAEEMIAGYRSGETPNPDVLCNKAVKFGGFYDFARAEGAAYVATGHYARIEEHEGGPYLCAGKDPAKDQSYFLWMMPHQILSQVLFPLGTLTKKEVRARAATLGLPNAKRPDSQGICFLGDISMKSFLQEYIDLLEGSVLDEQGNAIGTHEGAALYTIGQRHGFRVLHGGPDEPARYVIAKDVVRNTITVSFSPVPAREQVTRLSLRNTNWLPSVRSGTYGARFRYRQPLQEASLSLSGPSSEVVLDAPRYVPVGQSLVLYEGERVVGGGVIGRVSS